MTKLRIDIFDIRRAFRTPSAQDARLPLTGLRSNVQSSSAASAARCHRTRPGYGRGSARSNYDWEAPPVIRPWEREARAVAAAIAACNEAREGPNRRQLLQMARAKDSAKAVVASMLLLEEQPTSSAQSKPRGGCPTMACGLQIRADERRRRPWPLAAGLSKAAPLLRSQQPQQQPQQQQRQRATGIVQSQRQRHARSPAENAVHAKRYCRCWHAKPYGRLASQNLKWHPKS